MFDAFVILAPILLLVVVALLGFVGCADLLGVEDVGYSSVPKDLSAAPSNGGIKLTWTKADDTSVYNVRRWDQNHNPDDTAHLGNVAQYQQLGATTAGATEYVDPGPLTPGSTYYYRLETSSGGTDVYTKTTSAVAQAPAPLPVTLTFTGLNGPLDGIYQGVNFGTGYWTVTGGELAPVQDGQPQRSLTFPAPVNLQSITFSSTTATTAGLRLTNNHNQQLDAYVSAPNTDTTKTVNWASKTTSFAVTALPSTANAPDLRVRQILYLA